MGAAKRRRELLGAAYGTAQPPEWAWHYTLGRKIPLILRSGALEAAWDGAIFPVVWLTTADRPDPTSSAVLTLRGTYRGDVAAFKHWTGGIWRVGFRATHPQLHSYAAALAENPSDSPRGRWFRELRRKGEDRRQWLLSYEAIELPEEVLVQELLDGEWITHPLHTLSHDPDAPAYGVPGTSIVDCRDCPIPAPALLLVAA